MRIVTDRASKAFLFEAGEAKEERPREAPKAEAPAEEVSIDLGPLLLLGLAGAGVTTYFLIKRFRKQ